MTARLFASLSYRDAPAALQWLEAVGFDVVRRQDDLDGRVQHAEVRLGEALLMVASNDADDDSPRLLGRSTGQGIYLLVDDVDTTRSDTRRGQKRDRMKQAPWAGLRCATATCWSPRRVRYTSAADTGEGGPRFGGGLVVTGGSTAGSAPAATDRVLG